MCVRGGFVFSWFRVSEMEKFSQMSAAGAAGPPRVELLLFQNAAPPPPTRLTSLCGAQGQLVMFIASASDQRLTPQREKGGGGWEGDRKRKRERQMKRKREEGGIEWERGCNCSQKLFKFSRLGFIFFSLSFSVSQLTTRPLRYLHLRPALHMFDWRRAPL